MWFEVKRRFLLGFLLLTTLFLAWSLFVNGEKIEKLAHARDVEELSEAVTVKQTKGQPLPLAKLMQQRPPEPPPPTPIVPTVPIP